MKAYTEHLKDSRKKNRGGFTTVELIVTIVLVMILASGLIVGIMKWVEWTNFKRQNEYARTLFVAAQNQLTEYSVGGQLEDLQEAIDGGNPNNTGIVPIDKLLSPDGAAYKLEELWPESKDKTNEKLYQEDIYYLIGTEADYKQYQNGKASREVEALYDMLLPYVYDASILNATICVEFTPENGQVFSVLYSDRSTGFEYDVNNKEFNGTVDITDRTAKERKRRMTGYYGVDTLSKATNKPEKPSITAVRLNNEDTLNLSYRLDKVQQAAQELTYTIHVFDKVTKKVVLSITLEGKAIKSENFASAVNCGVIRYSYDQNGNVVKQNMGEYPVLTWIEKSQSGTVGGTIRVVLDAADLDATTALYGDVYDDLTDTQEEQFSTLNADVDSLKQTYSFRRFGVDVDDIYCTIQGSGAYYKDTAKKKSNTEHAYFGEAQLEEKSGVYALKNARHLYNIRYMEDFAEDERTDKEGLQTPEQVTYRLTRDISWTEFVKNEALFKSGVLVKEQEETTVRRETDFPSIRQLRENAVLEGNANKRYSIEGLTISRGSNNNANVYWKNETASVGLFLTNSGTIRDITLDQITVSGVYEDEYFIPSNTSNVGAFCGSNEGILENLTVDSTDAENPSMVSGESDIGGITGVQRNSTRDTAYTGLINRAQISGEKNMGGIAGSLSAKDGHVIVVKNCKNYGKVEAASSIENPEDAERIGGIVGFGTTTEPPQTAPGELYIQNCTSSPQYSDREIKALTDDAELLQNKLKGIFVGGIIGDNNGGILQECNTEKESAAKEGYIFGHQYVGGIVGRSGQNTTAINGETSGRSGVNEAHVIGNEYVGGITGIATNALSESAQSFVESVSNWTNKGAVIALRNYAGGIVGYNTGIIENCASDVENSENVKNLTSVASLEGNYIGGIAGYNNGQITSDASQSIVCYVGGKNFVGGIVGYNDMHATIKNYEVAGGYVKGNGSYIGGYAGLNASVGLLTENESLNSNPNEVNGRYFVGGLIGGNIIASDIAEIKTTFYASNFLGQVKAEEAFAGGFIGFNQSIPLAEGNKIRALTKNTADRLAEISNLEEAVAMVALSSFGEEPTVKLLIDGGTQGTQSRFGSLSAKIYVGGVIGYNDAATSLHVKNITNMTPVTAKSAIENIAEQENRSGFAYSYAGGIIGKVTKGITIENCGNQGVGDVISLGTYLGGLCEINEGRIINCYVSSIGSRTSSYVGGITGLNKANAVIENCTFRARPVTTITGNDYVGGIAAENFGKISVTDIKTGNIIGNNYVGGIAGFSEASSTIELNGSIQLVISGSGTDIGGIVGLNEANIRKNSSRDSNRIGGNDNWDISGSITGNANVGGVVGHSRAGNVTGFRNQAFIQAEDGHAGGIVGRDSSDLGITVQACNNAGEIVAVQSGNAGGIIGTNIGVILNCNNTGKISATNGICGGIAGENIADKQSGIVDTCMVSGTALLTFTGNEYAGGMVGKNSGTIKNSIVSGITITNLASSKNSAIGGITGINTGYITECNVGEDQRTILNSKAADVSAGGVAGTNTGIIAGKTDGYSSVNAALSFYQTNQAYYGNLGGVAGKNTGEIQYYEFSGEVSGTANNPQLAPEYNPNSDIETNGAVIYGYGGITGVNGDSAAYSSGTIRNCKVNTAKITGLGDPNNIANVGGIAGVNGLGASISNVTYGTTQQYAVLRKNDSNYVSVKNAKGSVYIGTVNGNATYYAHSGGVAGINSGDISDIQLGIQQPEKGIHAGDADSTKVIIENYYGHVGGIAGYNRKTGTINHVTTGKNWVIFAPKNAQDNGCGGIVGYQAYDGDMAACTNRAFVEKSVAGSNGVGGIIGRLETATSSNLHIIKCVNYGVIAGNQRVGGIVGVWKYYGGTISESENFGKIIARNNLLGGIVGYLYQVNMSRANIIRCENHGQLSGNHAGGILGGNYLQVYFKIENCVNTGTIKANASSAGIVGKIDNAKTGSEIVACNNYGVEEKNGNLAGILGSGSVKAVSVSKCFGVADISIPVSSAGGTAQTNYYFVEKGSKGKGTPANVTPLAGNKTFKATVNNGKVTIGLPGFPINPLEVYRKKDSKLTDSKLIATGDTGNNIRYQVFEADNPYFNVNATDSVENLDTPTNIRFQAGENASYKVLWNSVQHASNYQYELTYLDKDGNTLKIVEDMTYDTSTMFSIADINGSAVSKVTFRVKGCAYTMDKNGNIVVVESEYSDEVSCEILPILPTPQYHLELVRKTINKKETLVYQAFLDNQNEYRAFLASVGVSPEAIDSELQKITIHLSENNLSFNAYDAKTQSTKYYNGNNGNKMYSAYASYKEGGKYISSLKPMRESQALVHGVYVSTEAIANVILKQNVEDEIGFRGTTADTLSYQLKIGCNTGKDKRILYMRSELLATDMALGVPVAVSISQLRTSDTNTTAVATTLGSLPANLLDANAYKDLLVRSYPIMMSNNIVYIGHTVDISAVKDNSEAIGLTQKQLEELYVTEDHQVTKEPGTVKLIQGSGKNKKVADGFVIELAVDGSYTLYYNSLLEYNEAVPVSSVETAKQTMRTQVFSYKLTNVRDTVQNPRIHINEKNGVDGDPNEDVMAITWDLDKIGYENDEGTYNYKEGAVYDYVITGYTLEERAVQIAAGSYTTKTGGDTEAEGENRLTLNTTSWNYNKITVAISRRGEEQDGMTSVFPAGSIETYDLKLRFSQVTRPDITLHRVGEEVQKNSLVYDISWISIPENAEAELEAYEVLVERSDTDTQATTVFGTKDEFDTALAKAKALYESKSSIDNDTKVSGTNQITYTWTENQIEGQVVTKTMVLEWTEPKTEDLTQEWVLSKTLTEVWVFAVSDTDRDLAQYMKVLDLNDYERGETIALSVRALGAKDSKEYRDGPKGVVREITMPSRLDVPDVTKLESTPQYHTREDTNLDVDEKTYMTAEAFKEGVVLTLQPEDESGVLQGRYEIAAAVYDAVEEDAFERIPNAGDAEDESAEGYWNSGAIHTLLPKSAVTKMDGNLLKASYALKLDATAYAGKWLKIALRSISDSNISSYWSDEDDATIESVNYKWIQIPRMQVTSPVLEESKAVLFYGADGQWLGNPQQTEKTNVSEFKVEQTSLMFRQVEHTDHYLIQLIREAQTGKVIDPDKTYAIYDTDWIYLEKADEGQYHVFYATTDPDFTPAVDPDVSRKVSELNESAVYGGTIDQNQTFISLPYRKEVAGSAAVHAQKVHLVSYIQYVPESSDFMLVLPDTSNLDGYEDPSYLFTSQVSVQSKIAEPNLGRYEDSEITNWYRRVSGTANIVTLSDYADAPQVNMQFSTSEREDTAYEIRADSENWLVYQVKVSDVNGNIAHIGYTGSYGWGISSIDNITLLPDDKYAAFEGHKIEVRVAAVVSGGVENEVGVGGLSKWSGWTSHGVLPELKLSAPVVQEESAKLEAELADAGGEVKETKEIAAVSYTWTRQKKTAGYQIATGSSSYVTTEFGDGSHVLTTVTAQAEAGADGTEPKQLTLTANVTLTVTENEESVTYTVTVPGKEHIMNQDGTDWTFSFESGLTIQAIPTHEAYETEIYQGQK